MSLPPNTFGNLLNPLGGGGSITPPTFDYYEQEGNTDVYEEETGLDLYLQE